MSELTEPTRKEKSHEAETQQFLTFTVAEGEYGVDIMSVREIKGWTETTRLPNTPDYMLGVMNLRGLIVPIFDLRARLNKGATQANAKHVVIILAVGDRNIGILVDAVSDILTVGSSEIKQAPRTENDSISQYISGLILLENRMVVLLDVRKMFEATQITVVEAA